MSAVLHLISNHWLALVRGQQMCYQSLPISQKETMLVRYKILMNHELAIILLVHGSVTVLLIDLGECSTSSTSGISNKSSTTDVRNELVSDFIVGSNDSEMPDTLSTLTDSLLSEFDSTIAFGK